MPIAFTEYVSAIKKEFVDAIQGIFDSDYPDESLRGRIHVTTEYPLEEIRYPSVFLTYSEGPIRNMGVGHFELDDNGQLYYHWRFEGNMNFNILALSTTDRDMVAAGIINMLAFKDAPEYKNFHDDLEDADWIVLHPTTDYIAPGGVNVSPSPWGNEDQQIYASSYTIALTGELYSDAITTDLIMISEIDAYSYLTGGEPPTGAADPASWT